MAPKYKGKEHAGKGSNYNKPRYNKKKTYQAKTEKATYHKLMAYSNNNFKLQMNEELNGQVGAGGNLSCAHQIPVKIAGDLQKNFDRFVANKYEECRITSMKVKIMFKETDTPVWFLVDDDSMPKVLPDHFVNDENAGYKMVKENNNTLAITWRPSKGTTEADYKKVNEIVAVLNANPLGFIHLCQYDIVPSVAQDILDGKKGCTVHNTITLACRGAIGVAVANRPTEPQKTAMNAFLA